MKSERQAAHLAKLALLRKGTKHSLQTKQKISAGLKGKKPSNYGKGKKHSVDCAVCGCRKKSAHGMKCVSCCAKSRVGAKHSKETLQKIKTARAKQVFSEETILKIKIANTGKKDTLEARVKKSNARKGDKNPSWKGGVSSKNKTERNLAMNTLEYKLWREAVFIRDGFQCVFGGAAHGNKLNADHIKPWALFPKLRYEITNGRTLCVSCHRKTDTYARKILQYAKN